MTRILFAILALAGASLGATPVMAQARGGPDLAMKYRHEASPPWKIDAALAAACEAEVDNACTTRDAVPKANTRGSEDYEKVAKWLRKGCKRDHAYSCYVAGKRSKHDGSTSNQQQFDLLKRSCELGFGPGCAAAIERLAFFESVIAMFPDHPYPKGASKDDLARSGCDLGHPQGCMHLAARLWEDRDEGDNAAQAMTAIQYCTKNDTKSDLIAPWLDGCHDGRASMVSDSVRDADKAALMRLAEIFPEEEFLIVFDEPIPDTDAGNETFAYLLGLAEQQEDRNKTLGAALKAVASTGHDERVAQVKALLNDDLTEVQFGAELFNAVIRNDLDETRLLLKSGAAVDPGWSNDTELNYVARHRQFDFIPVLLEAGADPNRVGKEGRVPLMALLGPEPPLDNYPSKPGDDDPATLRSAIVQLLEHGADPNVSTEDGITPLTITVAGDRPDLVKVLLDHGADVRKADVRGATALHIAAFQGTPDLVDLLHVAGADIEARTKNDRSTPLAVAVKAGNANVTQRLLALGADPDAPGSDGTTPLLLAVRAENGILAQMLLDAGADPHAQNDSGHSPYNLVQQRIAAEERQARAEAQESAAAERRRQLAEARRREERNNDAGFLAGAIGAVAGAYIAAEAGMDVDAGSQLSMGLAQSMAGAASGNDRQMAEGQYRVNSVNRRLQQQMESRRRIDDAARRDYLERSAAASSGSSPDRASITCNGGPCLEVTTAPEPEPQKPDLAPASPPKPMPEPAYDPPSGDDVICEATGLTRAEAEASPGVEVCPA